MTMKHWRAWGTVPNQCWLKAVSSLPKKEKAENKVPSTMGRNRENKKKIKRVRASSLDYPCFQATPVEMLILFIWVFSSQSLFFLKLQSDEQEMPTFSLAGEQLLCSFCFLGVGPPSLKVQREQADTCGGQSPGTISAPLVQQGEGFAAFVLQRYSLLWLSFSVGKLFIKSKLDPLYVMAKFDSRAQF